MNKTIFSFRKMFSNASIRTYEQNAMCVQWAQLLILFSIHNSVPAYCFYCPLNSLPPPVNVNALHRCWYYTKNTIRFETAIVQFPLSNIREEIFMNWYDWTDHHGKLSAIHPAIVQIRMNHQPKTNRRDKKSMTQG